MRVLVLGGTGFIGRHIVARALARGHLVTLFHRGHRSTRLFPQAEHRLGDRDQGLEPLADGCWDATIDLSAYAPHQVRGLATDLGARAGRYVLFSSTAAYAPPQAYGFQEDAPLVALPDPTVAEVDDDTYGGLKALCEAAAAEAFPAPLIIRPTYVVGPYDSTGRFTYWVNRIASGGEVLAPGPWEEHFQLIDVRDLAEWVVDLVERATTGTYQAANPFPPVAFGQLLETVASLVAPPGTILTWVDKEFAEAAGLTGESLPLWPGANPPSLTEAADPARAIAAGLRLRPLEDTIRDLFVHDSSEPTPVDSPVGLSREAEADLLSRWRSAAGRG